MSNVKLANSSGLQEFDTMIVRTISRIKNKWTPAKIHGKPIRYRFRPVSYTHLDVYKRQLFGCAFFDFKPIIKMTNKDLLKIADQFSTPTYVYDADSIKSQYEKLTSSFHKSTRFFYACKALSNINILKFVNKLGASLDCVSINEVKLGIKAGFESKRILFTPNCVDLAEIEEAISLKVHINICLLYTSRCV